MFASLCFALLRFALLRFSVLFRNEIIDHLSVLDTLCVLVVDGVSSRNMSPIRLKLHHSTTDQA